MKSVHLLLTWSNSIAIQRSVTHDAAISRQTRAGPGQLDTTKPDINITRASVEMVPRYLPGVKLASDARAPTLTSQGPHHHANISLVRWSYRHSDLHPALFMDLSDNCFPDHILLYCFHYLPSRYSILLCCDWKLIPNTRYHPSSVSSWCWVEPNLGRCVGSRTI